MKKTILLIFSFMFALTPVLYGQAWENISYNLQEAPVYNVLGDLFNPSLLFATTKQSVYHTANGGSSWKRLFNLNGEDQYILFIQSNPYDSTTLYIGTTQGLFLSTDTGKHWKKIYYARVIISTYINL